MSCPRIRVYEATDGSGFATIYLDAKGQSLGLFKVHAKGKTAREAEDAARQWWHEERRKEDARKAGPVRRRQAAQTGTGEDLFA